MRYNELELELDRGGGVGGASNGGSNGGNMVNGFLIPRDYGEEETLKKSQLTTIVLRYSCPQLVYNFTIHGWCSPFNFVYMFIYIIYIYMKIDLKR